MISLFPHLNNLITLIDGTGEDRPIERMRRNMQTQATTSIKEFNDNKVETKAVTQGVNAFGMPMSTINYWMKGSDNMDDDSLPTEPPKRTWGRVKKEMKKAVTHGAGYEGKISIG